eukprot:Rhum_TRINITY_DN15304_c9_g1::Rhum_TRINITY_DN15304_c9_g1_i1::g.150039::m.150039
MPPLELKRPHPLAVFPRRRECGACFPLRRELGARGRSCFAHLYAPQRLLQPAHRLKPPRGRLLQRPVPLHQHLVLLPRTLQLRLRLPAQRTLRRRRRRLLLHRPLRRLPRPAQLRQLVGGRFQLRPHARRVGPQTLRLLLRVGSDGAGRVRPLPNLGVLLPQHRRRLRPPLLRLLALLRKLVALLRSRAQLLHQPCLLGAARRKLLLQARRLVTLALRLPLRRRRLLARVGLRHLQARHLRFKPCRTLLHTFLSILRTPAPQHRRPVGERRAAAGRLRRSAASDDNVDNLRSRCPVGRRLRHSPLVVLLHQRDPLLARHLQVL